MQVSRQAKYQQEAAARACFPRCPSLSTDEKYSSFHQQTATCDGKIGDFLFFHNFSMIMPACLT
jgi:hypothetical protein